MRSFGVLLLIASISAALSQNSIRCLPNRSDCCDRHRFCVFWSQRNECNINPTWMSKHCQVSCNTCSRLGTSNTSNDTASMAPTTARDSSAPNGCNSVTAVQVETRQVSPAPSLLARFSQLQCAEAQPGADCFLNTCYNKLYRSMDGTCNNVAHSSLGAAFTPFSRLLPAAYDDGLNALTSSLRRNRPNPLEITTFLLQSPKAISSNASSLFASFAQFLSHDLTQNALLNIDCPKCSSGTNPRCISLRFGQQRCEKIVRSLPVCGTGRAGRAREQLNMHTSFIDGSQIYGSEQPTSRQLRTGAFLRTQVFGGRAFPPTDMDLSMTAGDGRANLFLGLATMHSVFLLLHNNIASNLQSLNPRWNSDRIYQESRKIVGGILQHITYDDFLPILLGTLNDRLVPVYTGYKSTVNPSIINEFAGAAYRLHGFIQETYPLVDENFRAISTFRSTDTIARLRMLTSIDHIIRGLATTPIRMPQRISTVMSGKNAFQADLGTINIQRGRDHGFRSYNEYRKLCNLRTITNFQAWPEVKDSKVTDRMSQLYSSPDQVDLYVGGIIEEPQSGSLIGPTFSCIIAEQFVRLRDGDRLFYQNPGIFSPAQVESIRRTSMAWVLCETSVGIRSLPPNVFRTSNGGDAISCTQIPGLDLAPWKD